MCGNCIAKDLNKFTDKYKEKIKEEDFKPCLCCEVRHNKKLMIDGMCWRCKGHNQKTAQAIFDKLFLGRKAQFIHTVAQTPTDIIPLKVEKEMCYVIPIKEVDNLKEKMV